MTRRIQHRRALASPGPGAALPATLLPGELAVDIELRQLYFGAAGGARTELIPVRAFNTTVAYSAGMLVVYLNEVYRSLAGSAAGAWNPAQWARVTYSLTELGAVYAPLAHNHTGVYSPVGHDHAGVYSPVAHTHAGYLEKAGGIMTGALTLAADPTVALHAATKQWVEAQIAAAGTGKQVVSIPAGAFDRNPTPAEPAEGNLDFTSASKPFATGWILPKVSDARLNFHFQMPPSYGGGTIEYRFAYIIGGPVDSGKVVRMKMSLMGVADGTNLDTAFPAATGLNKASPDNAAKVAMSDWSAAVTPGGAPAASCMMYGVVHRDYLDAADTYGDPVKLLHVQLRYTATAPNDN